MPQPSLFPIREECPPGTCICERDRLLNDPAGDIRILRLTKWEEKKLIAHIEKISSYDGLKRMGENLQAQLGIALDIKPGLNEVRTVRGLHIHLTECAGLCKKTRQSIPAAIRKCLEKNPEIVYAILDAHDLLGDG
ncbi:MAG TPA: hypothetical protein VIF82_17055 [Burkholderiaceae bacterium]|jgi:hypothetical protein